MTACPLSERTGPYRAEHGAVFHHDHVGFLFTVSPPELAPDLARTLNEALAIAGSVHASPGAPAEPTAEDERWMVVAITHDGDDLVLRCSANLSAFVDGRHGVDSGLEVPASIGPGLFAVRDCKVYGNADEDEREHTTIEGTWVKLHNLSATGFTGPRTSIHQPSYEAGYAQGAFDTAQQADARASMVAGEDGAWEAHQGLDYTVVMRVHEGTDNASIQISTGDMEDDLKLAQRLAAFLSAPPALTGALVAGWRRIDDQAKNGRTHLIWRWDGPGHGPAIHYGVIGLGLFDACDGLDPEGTWADENGNEISAPLLYAPFDHPPHDLITSVAQELRVAPAAQKAEG